jgi:DNA-directed RNA polymerase subunit RPC12/RpoP
MKTCPKCGKELSDRALSCPHCGASLSFDVRLSVAVMKVLGIVCGIVGVALLVYGDQINAGSIKAESHPYTLWVWAGVFIVLGFVLFYRRWAERE